ncbi:hypothetical protein L1047_15880 [Synechococcus sp. Nb3U1]|uniref:hypothetical protein n=1 Tax=Synechococcus sp. Nb3U1 TaxID=1914529 RepID=UPI001F36187F|nr:hypothetical protein [Synechococcus sp. Nb3U1]MCF2972676.1 hypothetical protein [Synechococcus sp. Nb3U1]
MFSQVVGFILSLLLCIGCVGGGHWIPAKQSAFPLMAGLGSHHHPIETEDPVAQRYFDQGWVWLYGFNLEAAIHSFERAIERDPGCALCYWGMAYALGPNLADPRPHRFQPFQPQILDLLAQGQTLATDRQTRAYLWALSQRYSSPEPEDDRQQALNYAGAMRSLTTLFPEDLDAATLYAEALMLLSPGHYWTATGQPQPYTQEILTTLEGVLTQDPDHPGANHLYIHALEGSPTPEKALASAERLETLVPAAGHLLHMPAHIYLPLERFADAYRTGVKAIRADREVLQGSSIWRSDYARTYYPHHLRVVQAAAQNQPLKALGSLG